MRGLAAVPGTGEGPVLAANAGLSFWGGVDPATAQVIDGSHPLAGRCVTGTVLCLPTSRGSCSGSGILLDLALSGRAPAALVFAGPESVLTLGALVAAALFGRTVPVARVPPAAFAALARADTARVRPDRIEAAGLSIPLDPADTAAPDLTAEERAMLAGAHGPAVQAAMDIVVRMAALQGARRLTTVTGAHIDGCIYAGPAYLAFARRMADLGARVAVPTTTNAISVERPFWQAQGVDPAFGAAAAALADAYVAMGARPSFTCAPYLGDAVPARGEAVGWAESNAVVYANSVLGARTEKHPDFLDLCIAVTGRAPLTGAYADAGRRAAVVLRVAPPRGAVADAFWPLLGYAAGLAAPDRIPLIAGLAAMAPGPDDLKALCAAFGTTSGAPMLHIAGATPEATGAALPDAPALDLGPDALARAWAALDAGPETVDLVAFGSPHASAGECRRIADAFAGRRATVAAMVTVGRRTRDAIAADGTADRLAAVGVRVVTDVCWCSIPEPLFPPAARTVMTTSAKYAHYGPGLTGRAMRFGGVAACAEAAVAGRAPRGLPGWLA